MKSSMSIRKYIIRSVNRLAGMKQTRNVSQSLCWRKSQRRALLKIALGPPLPQTGMLYVHTPFRSKALAVNSLVRVFPDNSAFCWLFPVLCSSTEAKKSGTPEHFYFPFP
jgi:hypothetical protein